MKKILSLGVLAFGYALVSPISVFAQNSFPEQGVGGVLGVFMTILNIIIQILIIAAVAFFIYTVVMYILGKGDREQIVKGLVGLFLIVAFWGIIRIVQNTFGLDNNNQIQTTDLPCIQGLPPSQGGC